MNMIFDPLQFLKGGSTRKRRKIGREEKLRALSVIICEVPAALLPCATHTLDILTPLDKKSG